MKYVYPAVFHPEEVGGYSIWFPDIHQGATQGESMVDGIENAEDFLKFALYEMERDGDQIPPPSEIKKVPTENDEFVTLIAADTDVARRWHESRLVKKTLNIHGWLNERAEAAGVNFSQTLQTALKEKLQLGYAAIEDKKLREPRNECPRFV